MEKIIKIIGNAQIIKVERRSEVLTGWERRNSYLGFGGYLVIKLTEDGRYYACIDNGRRCITTSCGDLTLTPGGAVFETANSVYTFRLIADQLAG